MHDASSTGQPPPLIRKIAFFITSRCNMNCVYCYGDGGRTDANTDMKFHTACRTVDWLIRQSKEQTNLSILFFGGEPLLNRPLMEKTVDYARERGKELKKTFQFDMTTNATLLNEDVIAFLLKANIKPMVSLDGPKEIQDAQRPFGNGKGAYEAILPNIKRLLTAMPDVTCRATLFGSTNPARVKEELLNIGFSSIKILVVSPSPLDHAWEKSAKRNFRGMATLMKNEIDAFVDGVRTRNVDNIRTILGVNPLGEMMGRSLTGQKRVFFCGAGRSFAAVSPLGDIFPCHRFVGMDRFKIGSVFSDNLAVAAYQKSPLRFVDTCSKCVVKYVCGGGCYYDNLAMTGSIFEPAEDFCTMMRDVGERIAYVNDNLNEEDRTFLRHVSPTFRKPCPLDFP